MPVTGLETPRLEPLTIDDYPERTLRAITHTFHVFALELDFFERLICRTDHRVEARLAGFVDLVECLEQANHADGGRREFATTLMEHIVGLVDGLDAIQAQSRDPA